VREQSEQAGPGGANDDARYARARTGKVRATFAGCAAFRFFVSPWRWPRCWCWPFWPTAAGPYPPPRYSPLVLAQDGTVLHAYLNPTQKWRMKTELPEITPALQAAIIAKEDRYFRYHLGVNPVALVQAAGRNLLGRGRTTGASTITMQVARLLEPKQRTFSNKLLEILRAGQLEAHLSKAEILQLYLNLVPYGSNIEGVKSAAVLYFQQPPDYLSLAQTVTLAIIPNRPAGLVLGRDNARIVRERNRWLRYFQSQKLFPAQDIADALLEPLDARRHPAPRPAPGPGAKSAGRGAPAQHVAARHPGQGRGPGPQLRASAGHAGHFAGRRAGGE